MNKKLSDVTINKLKYVIAAEWGDIRRARKRRLSPFRRQVEPLDVSHKDIKEAIHIIRVLQREIDERKELGLYKLKDLREYYRSKGEENVN